MRTLQDVLEDEPANKPIKLISESYKTLATGCVSDDNLVKWYLCDALIVITTKFGVKVFIRDVVSEKTE